jgi:glycosyltransferase involved in cell wall biosynthesis
MKLSIVIPVYNEAENLPLLQASIEKSLSALEMDWEVVYIDDGSSDGSQNILEEMASSSPEHVCVVVFRRNFGQTAAIAAGIDHALGEIILFMDADLQNDPADIPMMIERLNEDYDVVSGWRVAGRTSLLRTLPSASNWMISP